MTKESKKSGSHSTGQEVDRLTNLPEGILHKILSLLEIKQAVQTSILSSPWKYLWTCLPDLNFDSDFFDGLESFEKFVLEFLSKRNGNSDVWKFRFFCRYEVGPSLAVAVVEYAVSHNVNHINFLFGYGIYGLPQSLVRCSALKTLEICSFYLFEPYAFMALTSLHLESCSFYCRDGDNSTACYDPFVNPPNLKNLCLMGCYVGGFKVFKISGNQLLNLTLKYLFYCGDEKKNFKLEISAPKLTFLKYRNSAADFSMINLPCLQQVDIDIYMPSGMVRTNADEQIVIDYKLNVLKFFHGICNAQFVTLQNMSIETLTEHPDILEQQASPFGRLKTLKLIVNSTSILSFMIPVKLITYFVGSSAFAETMLVECPEVNSMYCCCARGCVGR